MGAALSNSTPLTASETTDLMAYQPPSLIHGMSPELWALVKADINKGASDLDIEKFGMHCERTGLDPLARQIYLISRGGRFSVEVGIDGYRVMAERTGKYLGQVGPYWCGEDGVWLDHWVWSDPPLGAKVGILRAGFVEPVWGFARYDSYVSPGNPQWKKMPEVMLAKCSEANALRRAFPQQMGGLYTDDEMEQSNHPLVEDVPVTTPRRAPDVHAQRPVAQYRQPQEAKAAAKPEPVPFSAETWRDRYWLHNAPTEVEPLSNEDAEGLQNQLQAVIQMWTNHAEKEGLVTFGELLDWANNGQLVALNHTMVGKLALTFGRPMKDGTVKFNEPERRALSDAAEAWLKERDRALIAGMKTADQLPTRPEAMAQAAAEFRVLVEATGDPTPDAIDDDPDGDNTPF